ALPISNEAGCAHGLLSNRNAYLRIAFVTNGPESPTDAHDTAAQCLDGLRRFRCSLSFPRWSEVSVFGVASRRGRTPGLALGLRGLAGCGRPGTRRGGRRLRRRGFVNGVSKLVQ